MVVRWREERAHGRSGDEAIVRAMQTAGRAVVFSGTTVAIGLLALVALPLPFLRSVGYGGMLIPLISVIVALTLLPVVLGQARPAPRLAARPQRRQGQPLVDRLGAARGARPLGGGARRGARARGARARGDEPAARARRTSNTIAKQGDAKRACVALERSGIGSGVLLPARGARRRLDARPRSVAAALAAVPGVHGAVAPALPSGGARGAAVVDAFADADASTRSRARHARPACARPRTRPARTSASAASAAQNTDFIDAVYGNFPLMIALIALITFVLLARAFRSLLLPLKAVILNVISVAAAWGVLDARVAGRATARA